MKHSWGKVGLGVQCLLMNLRVAFSTAIRMLSTGRLCDLAMTTIAMRLDLNYHFKSGMPFCKP
jgi:hypothetical protein